MMTRTMFLAAAIAAAACGGPPAKQAGCPEGTVEKDDSCVPAGDSTASSGGDSTDSSGGSSGSTASTATPAPTADDPPPPSSGTPYDKQMVDSKIKRAAAAVKKNCGSATEDDGKAHGPWGSTKISLVIDNNGHSRDASIPSPYDGTAVGRCAVQAFNNFQFPPFKGADQHVDVDVEIVKPAGVP